MVPDPYTRKRGSELRSIKEFLKERLGPLVLVFVPMLLLVALSLLLVVLLWSRSRSWRRGPYNLWHHIGRTLDDLVEFAAVKPHATALGAIVDLDALPVTHDQRDAADRASHFDVIIH